MNFWNGQENGFPGKLRFCETNSRKYENSLQHKILSFRDIQEINKDVLIKTGKCFIFFTKNIMGGYLFQTEEYGCSNITHSPSYNLTPPISRILVGQHLTFCSLTSPTYCKSPRKCTPVKYKKRQMAGFPIVT